MSTVKLPLGSGEITAQESQAFASISGDFNPLHLDPVRARRYQFGSTLIHGINGTMRALDLLFADRPPTTLTSLQVLFNKPVQQGEELECFVENLSGTSDRVEVRCQGKKVQTIDVSHTPGSLKNSDVKAFYVPDSPPRPSPQNIEIKEAENLNGKLPLVWNPELFEQFFPNLNRNLPHSQCAAILGTTNIVGMICPGLNSVYARLGLDFDLEVESSATTLKYKVGSTDPRFSRVVIEVSNVDVTGEVEAYFRPTPVTQASFSQIRPLVKEGQYAGQHALIVGGSRGLGEVTAKILAAGGADTLVTYANGKEDAVNVSEDICLGGGKCNFAKLDILSEQKHDNLLALPNPITHIYYMASPLIEKSTSGLWDASLFAKYSDFYIRGLADLLIPFTKNPEYRKSTLCVYTPSTVFIDSPERGFSEYTVAKAAVESFAEQLRAKYPNWTVHTPRLPRMLTDQTSGIAGLNSLDSAKHMLGSLCGTAA